MGQKDGLNRGGNEGNRYGAGRKRSAVRRKLLGGVEKAAKYWLSVANGEAVVAMPGVGKQPDTIRKPTHEERGKAYEMLCRYGLGTQDEIIVLANDTILDVLADVLPEHIDDPDQVDAILVAVGVRLSGEAE